MDITPQVPHGAQIINGYSNGSVRIAGVLYTSSVIVMPMMTRPWGGGYDTLMNLGPDVEILIIGTGDQIVPIDSGTRLAFRTKGINLEVMDTGSACRTFNILLTEGRKVAAALMVGKT